MAYQEAAPQGLTESEATGKETQPLLQRKGRVSTTYRQCCCCSLGTTVTIWAVFLLAISTYVLFDRNVSGAAFTAGGVVGIITASLLLSAIGKRNAFPAFVAVYTQISLNIIWVMQLGLTIYLYWKVQQNAPDKTTYTVATAGWRQHDRSRWFPGASFLIIDLPLSVVLCARIALLGLLLVLSHANLRVLWSFYRVLQAGGTTFEFKTAEEIEEQALQAQLPALPSASPTPRHWDPLAQGASRSSSYINP
ncbi:hypothetical protein, conserved [Eimeria necatrix]|uniref:Transmembrane protein n=1 Tax=Eimeria necatrix TaxID=51315 RepID=U6ML49_9EIME|nr:hypothetical protein, conserved [Eimeria necatrix]CDJ63174.1 hypothetical protein, conserved [Eimeria necatrix]